MNTDVNTLNKILTNEADSILKDCVPWLSGFYPRNAKAVQYKEIN